jgi:hypothetical protein
MRKERVSKVFTAHVQRNGAFSHSGALPFVRATDVDQQNSAGQRGLVCILNAQIAVGFGIGRNVKPARCKDRTAQNKGPCSKAKGPTRYMRRAFDI